MCTPLVPLAGAINTVDQTRKNILGWQGKGPEAGNRQNVTNNYYGRTAEEAEGEASANKNALKTGTTK